MLQKISTVEIKKWRDSQYLDTWVNAIPLWLSMKGNRLELKEALDFIGFILQARAVIIYNHHLIKEKDKCPFSASWLYYGNSLFPPLGKTSYRKNGKPGHPTMIVDTWVLKTLPISWKNFR